jgi:hypothetical protein
MAFINEKAADFEGMEVRAKRVTYYPKEATTTVAQTTNRSTAVTLNATAGQITTDDTNLAAGAEATFQVFNSYVTAKTIPVLAMGTGAALNTTNIWVALVEDGSFYITVANHHASTVEDGWIIINFALIEINN